MFNETEIILTDCFVLKALLLVIDLLLGVKVLLVNVGYWVCIATKASD